MKRRKALTLAGYSALGLGAFSAGLYWQRPDLFHLGVHDHAADHHADTANFVMPSTVAPFTFPDVYGEMHSLSDWHGKHVLINFWATWCGPCREEVPLLIAMQEQFASRFQVVGLALDRIEPTRLFGDEYGINYPSLVPGQDEGFALLERYQPKAMLPFSLLIDAEHKVVSSKLGAYKNDELVEELTLLL